VDWPDGFGLIRASNTTPVLVLRFEGHTPEALARIEADMLALLRRVKPDAWCMPCRRCRTCARALPGVEIDWVVERRLCAAGRALRRAWVA
jgi:hypothetical protein